MKRIYVFLWIMLGWLLGGCSESVDATRSYPTYLFTHSDIVLFSYTDNTSLTVTDASGNEIWAGKLDRGTHKVLALESGVYHVVGTHPYATLVGDPIDGQVMGYYALDQNGRGTSELLYTYQSEGNPGFFGIGVGPRNFVIFAYQDDTSVTLSNSDNGQVIWQGTLNAGEAHFEPELSNLFLTVEASQPVSALSYSDQGYYVPADTGRFIGRRFYTWAGNAGAWVHDLNIIAYADNATVTLLDLDNNETLWQGTLQRGQLQVVPRVNERRISIESSADIAVSVSPTTSHKARYAHMLFAQDETGAGIGQNFYYPAIEGARLEIFAYENEAQIEVKDATDNIVHQGVLNQGESFAFDSQQTLYTITSDRPVSALMDWGNEAGADFAPPYYSAPTATLPPIAAPTIPTWLPLLIGLPIAVVGAWLLSRMVPRRPSTFRAISGPSRPAIRTSTSRKSIDIKRPRKRGSDVTHGRSSGKPPRRR